jgi:hypothetical protein
VMALAALALLGLIRPARRPARVETPERALRDAPRAVDVTCEASELANAR